MFTIFLSFKSTLTLKRVLWMLLEYTTVSAGDYLFISRLFHCVWFAALYFLYSILSWYYNILLNIGFYIKCWLVNKCSMQLNHSRSISLFCHEMSCFKPYKFVMQLGLPPDTHYLVFYCYREHRPGRICYTRRHILLTELRTHFRL